jgi:hypothetical protein
MDNNAFRGGSRVEVLTSDTILMESENDRAVNVPFISRNIRGMECHGRIVEIDHHEVFNSKGHKIINALIRNEPYQFAHQTVEYTIRVENISDEYPTGITDFCMYGSYLGRLQIGDEVIVRAKDRGDRRVVKSIYNQTTSSVVKPGIQIPAGVIRGIAVAIVLALITFIYEIVWFVKSGAAAAFITAVVVSLMPIIIICIGIWLAIKSILPGRRRRRRRY